MLKIIRNKQFLVPIILSLVFVFLSSLCLSLSIWHDEAYSAYLIRGDFADIWNLTALDVHPPLYYFCLKIWSLLFGVSEIGLRSMSIFWGVVAIFGAFYLVKKLFDFKTASIATGFMVLAPMFVRYAEEARMYTMVLAIVILSMLVLMKAVEVTWATKKSKWTSWWLLYGLLLAIGMWTHYFIALAFVTQLAYLVLRYRRQMIRPDIITGYVMAIVLFLPWLPECFKQVMSVEGGFWIPEVSGMTIINFLVESFIFIPDASWITNWGAVALFCGAVAIIGLIIYVITKRYIMVKNSGGLLLAMMVVVPPILLLLLSLPPLKPMFVSRYLVYSATILWLFLGVLVAKINSKKIAGIFGGLLFVVAILGLNAVFTRWANSDIKALLTDINVKYNDENSVIVAGTERIYLDTIFYSNDKMMVYGVEDFYSSTNGAFAPMKEYKYQIVPDFEDVPKSDNLWIILDSGEKNIPGGWTEVIRIDTDEHAAIKISPVGSDF